MSDKPSDDWYCPTCNDYVSGESVTFEEVHEICGTFIGEAWQKTKAALEAKLSKMEEAQAEATKFMDDTLDRAEQNPPDENCLGDEAWWKQRTRFVREALAGGEEA